MARLFAAVALAALVVPASLVRADGPAKSAADIMAAHDRALIRDLSDYAAKNPKAADLDQAYMKVFEKAIEHDWFADVEPTAKAYLADYPDGAVRPLAQIVATMARAHAGRFAEALASYKALMKGLGKEDQEEFATNFADNLANAASAEGEYDVARDVYRTLLDRFGENPRLREKVKDDLGRLDRIGKPAPGIVVTDLDGKTFRLAELRGKYVIVDFWATWCAPNIAELPNLQAAYAKYHAKGLEIVSVSLDETRESVADFIKARKVPWRQVHNASGGSDVVEAYGVNSIPATFLIDPDGKIVRLEVRGKALEKALASLIK